MIPALVAGYEAYQVGRKWLPYAIGGVGGLILAGILIGVPAYFMVTGARAGEAAAERSLAAIESERDIFKASADAQAAGAREYARVVESMRQQIKNLAAMWTKTRDQAERVAAETAARGKTIAALDRKLKEMTDAGADPADIALFNLGCLRRIEAGDPAAACAGPD